MLSLRPHSSKDSVYITPWITSELSFYQWSADRMEGKYPLTAKDLDSYYAEESKKQEFWAMTAIDEFGVLAGQLIMRMPEDTQRTVRLGFIILNPSMRGKGYGKEMVSMAAEYAFRFLHADKVTLGVFTNNPSARYCYEAAGFAQAGENKSVVHGESWDCVEMELTKEVWERDLANKMK